MNTGDCWSVETGVCYGMDNNRVNTGECCGVETGVYYGMDNN